MEYRTLQCREHGGNFKVPAKRGRPPTRCGGNYPTCDMVTGTKRRKRADGVAKAVSRTLKGETPKRTRTSPQQAPKRQAEKAVEAAPVVIKHNPSIPLAKKAKDQLEPLGWVCTATKDDDTARVAFTATRGDEFLSLLFENGKVVNQDYWLWDANKTAGQNGKPKSRLPFNPDEMSDAELATALRGKQVEWWNRIKSGKEKATISMKQIKIEHTFYDPNPTDDDGNEIEPSEPLRIVSFVDPTGGGFRSFHVDALMRVSM